MAITVLMAEDNEMDAALFRRAFARLGNGYLLHIVEDGEQALEYLKVEGQFTDRSLHPFPDCLLLDLKMPRKSGFDVLEWLQKHPDCSVIPTVVFTASELEEDISRAYQLGANTYFTKPSDFHELVDLLKMLFRYWEVARRPAPPLGSRCTE